MSRLDRHLVQTCEIVSPSRNAFGDYVNGSTVTESCRFREVSSIRRTTNSEQNDTDAMIWLGAATTAENGSIILFDSVYYQVERITKARKLGKSTIEFIKADLKITDIGIS